MIRNLEALRALAAWMVVAHHLRDHLGQVWAPLGETLVFAAGVDVFFVLSGVVMVVSTDGRGMTPGAFWARRLARIAPLYWLATLALLAGLSLGLSPVGIKEWTAGDAVASFLFWPDMRSDGFPGPLLAVGWTLTYEAGFYALFGLCQLAGARAGRLAVAVLVLAAITGLIVEEGALYAFRVWTAPLMLEFAAGVAIGHWWRHGGSSADGVWPLCIAIAAVTVVLGGEVVRANAPDGELIAPGSPGATWRVLCFGAPAAVLVIAALMAERRSRVASWAWVQRQGAASYAVYLLHLPLIQVMEKSAGGTAILIAPPLIALAALVVHDRVERPLTRALRRVFGRSAASPLLRREGAPSRRRADQQRPKSSSRRMMSSSSR